MARTKGEEAIVDSDQEIQRRKRVNNEKDAHSTKKAKVEGNKAAELPICDGRSLCDEIEEAASLCDGELKRLRRLLADDPKKLSNKDMEDVIHNLEIDEIVRLALESSKEAKRSDIGDIGEEEWIGEDHPHVLSSGKVLIILKSMIRRIENVEEADFCLLYENFPHVAFAPVLLLALDSYSYRRCRSVPLLKEEERAMVLELCRVLPWKLFAHVLSHKTFFPVLKFTTSEETSEESYEECPLVLEEAAKNCEICLGKGKHSGHDGYNCSFWEYVPKGVTVGSSYWVVCGVCGRSDFTSFCDKCFFCDSEAGKVVCIPKLPKI